MHQPANHTSPAAAASLLVAALEHAWQAIRQQHPRVPEAVLVVATGAAGKRLALGHFAPHRWQVHGNDRHEVLVGGEGLQRGPVDVLGTLLHEAAHGLAQARGIAGTSRQGRYHNHRYATLARELGLDVTIQAPIGWSATSVPSRQPASTHGSSRSSRRRWSSGGGWRRPPPPGPGRATYWPAAARVAASSGPPAPPWPRPRSSAAPASNPSNQKNREIDAYHGGNQMG
jgi:hypothetical protein